MNIESLKKSLADKSITIGFNGLGIMGYPLAQHLLKAGYKVILHNRTRQKANELSADYENAIAAEDVTELKQANIVFTLLTNDQVVEEFILQHLKPHLRTDSVLVNMATIRHDLSIKLNQQLPCRYFEAPLVGSKVPAQQGKLVILTAGEQQLHELLEPVFELWSKQTFYTGATGNAAKYKLINNQVMTVALAALSEGLAITEKMNLNPHLMQQIIDAGAFNSPMFNLKGPKMTGRDFAAHFPLEHATKDISYAVEQAKKAGLNLPVAKVTETVYREVLSNQKEVQPEDFSSIYRYFDQ